MCGTSRPSMVLSWQSKYRDRFSSIEQSKTRKKIYWRLKKRPKKRKKRLWLTPNLSKNQKGVKHVLKPIKMLPQTRQRVIWLTITSYILFKISVIMTGLMVLGQLSWNSRQFMRRFQLAKQCICSNMAKKQKKVKHNISNVATWQRTNLEKICLAGRQSIKCQIWCWFLSISAQTQLTNKLTKRL